MPNYKIEGKIEVPTTQTEFNTGMRQGKFIEQSHRAYAILLFYTGIRKTEPLKAIRDQFKLYPDKIMFDVGQRLKHSKKTLALPIPLSAPFVPELVDYVIKIPRGERVFTFCPRTCYNIIRRVWHYPHLFRLSRITWFFQQGFSIAEVRSWTGLSLHALEYYIGITNIEIMGNALGEEVIK